MEAQIRPFREGDLDAVLDIAVAAWTPIYASFEQQLGPDLFAEVFPAWEAEKKRQVAAACRGESGARVLVAERTESVIGFISYYLRPRLGIGEIGNNAVHPAHQGGGIGTALYTRVLAEMKAQGMACATVTTGGDPAHAPARRAYEKAGFSRALPAVTYYRRLHAGDGQRQCRL